MRPGSDSEEKRRTPPRGSSSAVVSAGALAGPRRSPRGGSRRCVASAVSRDAGRRRLARRGRLGGRRGGARLGRGGRRRPSRHRPRASAPSAGSETPAAIPRSSTVRRSRPRRASSSSARSSSVIGRLPRVDCRQYDDSRWILYRPHDRCQWRRSHIARPPPPHEHLPAGGEPVPGRARRAGAARRDRRGPSEAGRAPLGRPARDGARSLAGARPRGDPQAGRDRPDPRGGPARCVRRRPRPRHGAPRLRRAPRRGGLRRRRPGPLAPHAAAGARLVELANGDGERVDERQGGGADGRPGVPRAAGAARRKPVARPPARRARRPDAADHGRRQRGLAAGRPRRHVAPAPAHRRGGGRRRSRRRRGGRAAAISRTPSASSPGTPSLRPDPRAR